MRSKSPMDKKRDIHREEHEDREFTQRERLNREDAKTQGIFTAEGQRARSLRRERLNSSPKKHICIGDNENKNLFIIRLFRVTRSKSPVGLCWEAKKSSRQVRQERKRYLSLRLRVFAVKYLCVNSAFSCSLR